MTYSNLLLSEKAFKAHSKRLQKELKSLNQDLPLTQVQNLLSKTFGFNNFHELKKILSINEKKLDNSITYKNLINTSKNQTNINNMYLKACYDGDLDLLKLLLQDNNIINRPELECKDIHGNINGAVHQACLSGNVDIVKYLLEDIKINIKKDAWLFFYCRTKEVFKYISFYLDVNNQDESFVKKFKKILINSPFYDYDTFKEILGLKVFKINNEELDRLLYNIIIKNNGNDKIIEHLIKLGANLYNKDNDIFLKLMINLTELENNDNEQQYTKDKIKYIKNMISHLDKEYNYLNNYNITDTIEFFKKQPDSLYNEWKVINNSYIKNLIA